MSNIIREGDVLCPPVATYFGKRIGGDPLPGGSWLNYGFAYYASAAGAVNSMVTVEELATLVSPFIRSI